MLEAEVRDLKDLLDEKDEKIEMLSKMHGNRRPSIGSVASAAAQEVKKEASLSPPPKEDTFRVQASPLLLGCRELRLVLYGRLERPRLHWCVSCVFSLSLSLSL